jgi:NADPH:quinone reductase-like Zn-dependent oxidoreductase
MRQIWIPRPGRPEVLEIRETELPEPKPNEMRIKVEAAGINFADISGRLGIYQDLPPMPVVVGYEVGGCIDKIGENIDPVWLGKDVLGLTRFGGYSESVCVDQQQVFSRPAGMTAAQGAALPVNYLTAYQLVCVMGGVRAGETVLIHSAGGGVGIAAIQLAKHRGAKVIGTASTRKHEYLKQIGVEHCIDYRQEDFEKRVMEITSGAGVELVLDAVGGKSFKKSYRSLSATGRMGMFGVSSAAISKSRNRMAFLKMVANLPWFKFTPIELINNNKGVFGVNLGRLWGEMDRVGSWMEDLLELYSEGVIAPRIDATFHFSEAAAAHHYIQDRKNIGKVLLIP